MKWLFLQTWVLLLVSFLIGALVTWLVTRPRKKAGTAPADAAASTPHQPTNDQSADATWSAAEPAEPVAATAPAASAGESARSVAEPADERTTEPTVEHESAPVAEPAAEPARVGAAAVDSGAKAGAATGSSQERDDWPADDPADQRNGAPSTGVPAPAPPAGRMLVDDLDDGPDLDTPAMGFPLPTITAPRPAARPAAPGTAARPGALASMNSTPRSSQRGPATTTSSSRTPAAGPDSVAADGFAGSADDTIVIDADVAAGRSAGPAAAAPAVVVESPYQGGVLPLDGGAAPSPEFVIKGNVDSMLYHDPASPSYQQTMAEVWFRDSDDAEDAGFRPWNWRARTTGGLPKLGADGMPVAGSTINAADAAALARAAARSSTGITPTAGQNPDPTPDPHAAALSPTTPPAPATLGDAAGSASASPAAASADTTEPEPASTPEAASQARSGNGVEPADATEIATAEAETTAADDVTAPADVDAATAAADADAAAADVEAAAGDEVSAPADVDTATAADAAAELAAPAEPTAGGADVDGSGGGPATNGVAAGDGRPGALGMIAGVDTDESDASATDTRATADSHASDSDESDTSAAVTRATDAGDSDENATTASDVVSDKADSTPAPAFASTNGSGPVPTALTVDRAGEDAEPVSAPHSAMQGLAAPAITELPNTSPSATTPSPNGSRESAAVASTTPSADGSVETSADMDADSASGRTADLAASNGGGSQEAGPAVVVEAPYGPGSARPRADGSAPSEEFRIKGNGDSMLYHTVDSPYFGRTRPEAWFRTEEDAQRAGFNAWNRRARQSARALAKPAFEEGRYPGSAKPGRAGTAPTAEFTVKGDEDSMLYHTAESPFFGVTLAEVWFRSEADAQRAGFTAWHAAAPTS